MRRSRSKRQSDEIKREGSSEREVFERRGKVLTQSCGVVMKRRRRKRKRRRRTKAD